MIAALRIGMLVALGALAAFATPSAWAGTYEVEVCTRGGDGEGLTFFEALGSGGFETEFSCGNPGRFGGRLVLGTGSETNVRGGVSWTLRAAADTAIQDLKAVRSAIPSWAPATIVWEVSNGRGERLDRVSAAGEEMVVEYAVNSTSASIAMQCTRTVCETGVSGPGVRLNEIVATLLDTQRPEVEVPTVAALLGPLRGTVEVPFTASDKGAGVQQAILFVDGAPVATTDFLNDGKCVRPFRSLVPCKLELKSSFALDTTKLADGPHLVHVLVGDGAAQPANSDNILLTVDNRPPPGDASNMSPPAAGQGTRSRPALNGLILSPRKLKLGRGRARLRFNCSEGGTLSVTVAPAGPGAARRKVAKPLASATAAVAAGPGSIQLRTRAKGKALRPGAYRLTATLRTGDGRVSAPATLRFRVRAR